MEQADSRGGTRCHETIFLDLEMWRRTSNETGSPVKVPYFGNVHTLFLKSIRKILAAEHSVRCITGWGLR